MSQLHLTRNEVIVLGVLALLTLLVLFVPWKRLVIELREFEAGKYDYARVMKEKKSLAPPQPDWRIKTDYSLETGSLRIILGHETKKPSDDLTVSALFTPEDGVSPVARTFLRNHSGGVYGAENLNLSKGNWVMSLTGRRNLEFVFRREEVLKVE